MELFLFCTFVRTHLHQSSQDTSSARTGTSTGWGRSVRLIHTERLLLAYLLYISLTISLTFSLKDSTLQTFQMVQVQPRTLVAGAWTEREKMYHGGSFLKLADDNMDIQNPEAQNRVFSGF